MRRLRGVRVSTAQYARLALGELEAARRVDHNAWLHSQRGENRRLALDPHVLPMDEHAGDARVQFLAGRSLRQPAEKECITNLLEANPAALIEGWTLRRVRVRVDGRERELTNHAVEGQLMRLPSRVSAAVAVSLRAASRSQAARNKVARWLVWYHPCSKVSKVGHDSAQRGFTKLTNNSQRSPRSLFPQTKHHSGPPALSPSASALHHASFESATAVAVLTLNEMAEAS